MPPERPLTPWASASEMLAALRARQISAQELLELHLERIACDNPLLNAIVIPDYDRARKAASAADAARARGGDSPLLGLPLTVKESIDVQGLPGAAGVPAFAERRAEADAPLVSRLRQAGGVIIGKTNVPTWLWDWQANSPLYGRTNNPWDLTRTPGGSTGGGSAALAAGLTPLEFGSDIAGSIRVPAAFCGVYGHRPSDGAVPGSGHFPGGPLPDSGSIMGVLGPLARGAEDLALAFDVVAGPEIDCGVAWQLAVPPPRHDRLKDYCVAIFPTLPWVPVDAEISEAIASVVAALQGQGVHVATAQPDGFGDLRDYFRTYVSLLHIFASGSLATEERQEKAAALRTLGDDFSLATADGYLASALDYLRWRNERERYRATFRDFFQDWDLLLAPLTITPAFPHIAPEVSMAERVLRIDGADVPCHLQMAYPALATLSGQPATAFPIGRTRSGLPIGMQAIDPFLEDHTTIRFAALLANLIGGFVPPPPLLPVGQ